MGGGSGQNLLMGAEDRQSRAGRCDVKTSEVSEDIGSLAVG